MRTKENNQRFSYSFIFVFLLSLLICYVVTAMGTLLLALLLLIFHIPIELTDRILYGIYGGAVLCGGFCMQKMKIQNLRFQGFLLGLLYSVLLFVLSGFLNREFQLWQQDHGFMLLYTTLMGGITEIFFRWREK